MPTPARSPRRRPRPASTSRFPAPGRHVLSPFCVISTQTASLLKEIVVEVSTEGSGDVELKEALAMPYTKNVDLLEPIDLAEHLDKIELYLGQVCAIAGISKMQLDYWTNKAQIPTKGKKQRIYDMDAVETVMLIKQAKDKGLNLGAAIDAAQRFRAQKVG